MSFYRVEYEGQPYYVEAQNISTAIDAWKHYMTEEVGGGVDEIQEPDSVVFIHKSLVIRERKFSFPPEERELWMQYAGVLTAELDSCVPIAYVHGWRSSSDDVGRMLRRKLQVTEDDIRSAARRVRRDNGDYPLGKL